jgi:hypothetical protein
VYKSDNKGKSKLDGHREVLIETIRADDKTEAQLIAGAVHGVNVFVCSDTADRHYHSVIANRPE